MPSTKIRSRNSIGAVRSPESTKAILNAAAEILETEGYRAFTLDAVVAKAGASKPTIYRWWGSKAALIRDVYEHSSESALVIPDYGDLEKELSAHLHSLWCWWRESLTGEALRSFITEMQSNTESMSEFRAVFLPRRERILRQIFNRAVQRGEIQDGAQVEAAVSMLTGISWLHLLTDNLEKSEVLDHAIQVIVQGLRSAR